MASSMEGSAVNQMNDAGATVISKSKRRRDKKKQKQQNQQQQPQAPPSQPQQPQQQQPSNHQLKQKQQSPGVDEQSSSLHQHSSNQPTQQQRQQQKPHKHSEESQKQQIQQKQQQQQKERKHKDSVHEGEVMGDRNAMLSQSKSEKEDCILEGAKAKSPGKAASPRVEESKEGPQVEEMKARDTKPPEGVGGDGGDAAAAPKSKAQLRAERRQKQEAQRAAKAEKLAASGKAPPAPKDQDSAAAGKGAKKASKETPQKAAKKAPLASEEAMKKAEIPKENTAIRVMDEVRHDDPQVVKKRQKKMEKQKICPRVDIRKKVDLFSHLPQYQIGRGLLTSDWEGGANAVHPVVYRYGMRMAYGKLAGAHNRCCALIDSVLKIILCYKFSKDKEFARDFENTLSPNITFLSQCRPMTAGMRTFLKHFKANVVSIGRDEKLKDDQKLEELKKVVEDFYKGRLFLARKAICERAVTKINDGDCLLVYAHSSLVRLVLDYAWHTKRQFRVIVADSDPLWEGREMLRYLESRSIPCEYVSLSGVPSIMPRVSRVLLGAQALLNNGSVLSRAGTGLVAAVAHELRRAVIVLCESYKFWERVQLDSFVYNELGDPNALVDNEGMQQLWDDPKSGLHYLNPIYDITPSDLVDMVITERSIMPATSVPVVLRSKNAANI